MSAALDKERYISLETFKRDGTGVRTPVWFAEQDGLLYIYTLANVGKVKRIRNNPRVRFAACDMRGKVHGERREGAARLASEAEAAAGQALLRKKYWPWKSIGDFFSRLRGRQQAVIVIRPAS
jgi:hypothetical protein